MRTRAADVLRHPALAAPAKTIRRRISPPEIPTLEIEVGAEKTPALDATIERVIEANARSSASSASRRSSQQLISAVVLGLLAGICAVAVLEALITDNADGPAANGATAKRPAPNTRADIPRLVLLKESLRAPAPLLATTELLQSISELLDTRELRDEATIDFAVQTLKTILLVDSDNDVARQRLEDLTRQLADEATDQFEQGNDPLARRLIAQAADSGFAFEYVRVAADYIASQHQAVERSDAAATPQPADSAPQTDAP